jgi:DNA-binding NarL/FixJ family response regulator
VPNFDVKAKSSGDRHCLRVVLIAGEPLFRLGFRAMLEGRGDLELVDEAAEARTGFPLVEACKPEVVAIDLSLPGMNGIAATRELSWRAPGVRVLLLGSSVRERDVLEGLAAGAAGFALKGDSTETLLDAIRLVGQGQRYLASEMRGIGPGLDAPSRRRLRSRPDDVLASLSAREREVLDLVVRGWTNREMAQELCIAIKTIDTHRSRINRKLNCRNAGDLIRFAAENGLLAGATPDGSPVAHESPAVSAPHAT